MKKLITQICSVSLLATSLTSFGVPAAFAADLNSLSSIEISQSSKMDSIRSIMANYTSNIERAEGNIKSLHQATIALKANNVSAQELVEFAALGMDKAEAAAYRSIMMEKMAIAGSKDLSNEELGELVNEVTASMNKGANFRVCEVASFAGWIGGISLVVFGIMAIDANGKSGDKEEEIKDMKLTKVDLESDINILIGEGVKPESFLIASIKKDIAYMDEQMEQAESEKAELDSNLKLYAILAGAGAAVGGVGLLLSDCYRR